MSLMAKHSLFLTPFPVENTLKRILLYIADFMSFIFVALKIQTLERDINKM